MTCDLLEEGLTNRTTAATAMNVASSRSHAVFTLELFDKDTDEQWMPRLRLSLG